MKERKPLFPEYIWMFFVGLLLAIIVCMRLLPGHAETVNPVYGNPNVFTWESLQNPTSVFQAPFNTSGWINSEGNIYLDASVYRSDNSGASFYGPLIDYEYVALQNPIIYGQIGATYSGTDFITVSSNNNNGPVPVKAIPSSMYYTFFEHGYSYFACDLWCFPWGWWSLEPVNIGYAIVKMTSGTVPSVYKVTGLHNYPLFQVDINDSNVVDIMYYWNQNIDNFDAGLDYSQNIWVNFSGGLEGIMPGFVFTNPESNQEYKLFISTVYRGNFNFQHTGDWNEQYSKNYKYRITVDSRYFQVKSAPSPTPTPEPEVAFSFIVHGTPFFGNGIVSGNGYYLVDVYGSDIYAPLDIPLSSSNVALSTAIANYSVSPPWVRPAVIFNSRSNDFSYAIYFSGTLDAVKIYYTGSVLPSSSKDVIRENFSPVDLPLDTAVNDFYAGTSQGLNVVALFFGGTDSSLIDLDFSEYGYYALSGDYFLLNEVGLFRQDDARLTNPLVQGYHVGLSNSPIENITPTPSPTPEGWVPTVTPTVSPTPVTVEVILPSPTPGPTAPVSFSGSDLPGGGAGGVDGTFGNAGSISTNGGASPSTANGVYNYWSTVLSQNQALAFIASFFQILPFDLVYALGSLIFTLILLAMARLFIHFID